MDNLAKFYDKISKKVSDPNTPWYKETWFVILLVLCGIAVGLYLYYLENKIDQLRVKRKLARARAIKRKNDLKLENHKKERKRLENKVKKAVSKEKKVGEKIKRLARKHATINDKVENAENEKDLRDIQNEIRYDL